jgi:hypothetical protein
MIAQRFGQLGLGAAGQQAAPRRVGPLAVATGRHA